MNRRNILLAVLLVVQLVVAAVMSRPEKKGPADGEVKFFDFGIDRIVEAVITDNDGNKLTLVAKDDSWLINPPDDFPGNADRIKEKLKQLVVLKSDRLVSRTKASHARLQVGDEKFNRRIELKDKDKKTSTLYLGTTQGSNGIHVRSSETDDVYFATGLSVWDFATNASQWWQNRYIDVDEKDIQALQLKNEHGTVSLKRDSQGKWVDSANREKSLDQDKVKKVIDQGRTITITDYLKKESPEKGETPLVTVTLTAKDNQKITFDIGKKDEKDQYVISKTSSKSAKVSKVNIEQLLSITGDQLLAKDKADQKEEGEEKKSE